MNDSRDHSRVKALSNTSLGQTLFDGTPARAAAAASSSYAGGQLVPLSQGSSTPDEPPHYSLGGAKGGHDSSSSVHGAGAPPLTARTASSAASSQLSGRFFDQTSTAEKGRYRVHDARSVLPLPLFVVGLSHPSVPLTPCPCGFASLSLSLSLSLLLHQSTHPQGFRYEVHVPQAGPAERRGDPPNGQETEQRRHGHHHCSLRPSQVLRRGRAHLVAGEPRPPAAGAVVVAVARGGEG